MQYEVELSKWKWLILKDMELWHIWIWINWPWILWNSLITKMKQSMKLIVWDSELNCWLWDSTQPIRINDQWNTLIHLLVEIDPIVSWVLLVNNLKLNLS